MAVFFFDSSGLVKRYVPEVGSAWVHGLTDPLAGHLLSVARIAGPEVVAAITRRQRMGNIAAADAAVSLTAFRRDFPQGYLVLEITARVAARAMDLAEVHKLRGYDAVPLAVALGLRDQYRALGLPDPMMITADRELYAAAVAEGLPADDPNAHP